MANVKIKVFAVGFAGALALSAFAGSAMAAKPANPGCFGQDRAAVLHLLQDDLITIPGQPAAPGASEWGHEAGVRGADNGQINRDYKLACGGAPTSD